MQFKYPGVPSTASSSGSAAGLPSPQRKQEFHHQQQVQQLKYLGVPATALSSVAVPGLPGPQRQQVLLGHPQPFQQLPGTLPALTMPEPQFRQPSFRHSESSHNREWSEPMVLRPAAVQFTGQSRPTRLPKLADGVEGSADKCLATMPCDPSMPELQSQVRQVTAMARATMELVMVTLQKLTTGNGSDVSSLHSQDLTMYAAPRIAPPSAFDVTRLALQQPPPPNIRGSFGQSRLATMGVLSADTVSTVPIQKSPSAASSRADSFNVTKEIQDELKRLLQTASRNNAWKERYRQVESAGSVAGYLDREDEDFDIDKDIEDALRTESYEEWRKLRLRIMSRLRKRRWRARKKAEVLAGVGHARLEEEERLRRDRSRKQQGSTMPLEHENAPRREILAEAHSPYNQGCMDLPISLTTSSEEGPQASRNEAFMPSTARTHTQSCSVTCMSESSNKRIKSGNPS